jgi:ABC-type branched-subunit amino acid transport system substrate-binding protein
MEEVNMCKRGSVLLGLAAIVVLLLAVPPASAAGTVAFTLKFGTLAGMTGDPAIPGQAWTEAGRLAVDYVDTTLKTLGLSDIKVVLSDSQDSQGIPQAGVEAAQKLININHVDVIIGDMWSSVTSAVARSVAIPNKVLMFTGGTNPALTKLNTPGTPAIIWQPVPADDLQGRVLASIIADALGKNAKINVAARNDAYGANLAAVFKDVWTAGGGTIPKYVIYNHQQPTLESEAQELVQGNPDGWLFIDFCQTFSKLAQPLTRTGKWNPAKSFGSDVLIDCKRRGAQNWPGMRATQANTSSGSSFLAFKALFEQKAKRGVTFAADLAEPWDSVFVAFLAAVEAKSSDPMQISQHIVSVTNPPGTAYTFLQLDQAIRALLRGEKIHFNGASGPLQFTPEGRVSSTAYDIWQHNPDGTSSVFKTITFKP